MDKSTFVMPRINLIRKRRAFFDTFLRWALSTGRLIIIITETIALSAFAMRFSLDRQIIDLHDQIKPKQAVIKALEHDENNYRNLQDRLTLIHTLDAQAQNQTKTFFALLDTVPEDAELTRFDFTQNTLQLDIAVRTTTTLALCIQNLKTQPNIANVSVSSIDNRISDGVIHATIVAEVKI